MSAAPATGLSHSQPRRRATWGEDSGRVAAFTVVITAAVLLFAGLVLDGGLALAAKVRAVGQAQEAARAGAQAIDLGAYRATGTLRLDPDRAAVLAQTYLADARTSATEAVTVTGDTVTVTLTVAQPTRLLGLVGVRSISVTGTGTAHPDRGPTAAGPGAAP